MQPVWIFQYTNMQSVGIFSVHKYAVGRDIPVHKYAVSKDIPVHKYAVSRDIFSTQICSQ
jgi:hypothetical protein